MGFIWTVVAACWDVLLGHAGVVSYGQMAMFAVGAYATGILTIQYGVPPLLGVAAGGIAAAALAMGTGLATLRLSAIYFALVSFAIHFTLAPMLVAGREFGTGGSQGIWSIPSIALGPLTLGPTDTVAWYYTAWTLAALTVLLISRLTASPLGSAFTALRDSPMLAQSLGIHAFSQSPSRACRCRYPHWRFRCVLRPLCLVGFSQDLGTRHVPSGVRHDDHRRDRAFSWCGLERAACDRSERVAARHRLSAIDRLRLPHHLRRPLSP